MSELNGHEPGAICWIELGTTDQDGAKRFYTSVFGWTFEDSPMGPGDFYTMFQLGGRNAAAAYTQHAPEREAGVPPHWNLYIAVRNADETASRAAELGARILAPPFDVATYGRMAVIQDPSGAAFCIWQAKDHAGMGVQGEHGAFCWADLNTPDQESAKAFYGGLFGWTFENSDSGYLHIRNGQRPIGGVPPEHQRDRNAPPFWMIYFQTDDCDQTTEKAKSLGAEILFGPVTMEHVGRFTVLKDPQGAASALFQPMR